MIQESGLQAQAIFQKKLNIKPCSTDSQTHRKLTMSIAERVNRASKVRILPVVFENPETRRAQLQTEEDKRSKDERIKAAKIRAKTRQRLARGSNKLSRNYLENDGGSDEETSINAIKRKTAKVRKAALKRGRTSSMSDFIVSPNSEDEGDKASHASNEDESILSSKEESDASSLEPGVPLKRRSSAQKEDSTATTTYKKPKVVEDSESSDDDDDM